MKVDFDLQLDENQTIKDLHLEDNGLAQKICDSTFIHYMRLKMPLDNGIMIANTKAVEPGLVVVNTPYAHYMNTGILYVNPVKGRSGFPVYEQTARYSRRLTGFVGFKGKRVPTAIPLKYHAGPGRSAMFVERTIKENTNDIINAVAKVVKND